MKLNKIAKLCKASGTLLLYDADNGEQWVSDTYTYYPLYGLPP